MPLVLQERTGQSGYSPFPPYVVLEERTGQAPVAMEMLSLEGALPLGRIEIKAGDTDADLRMRALDSLLGTRDATFSITSYREPVVVEAPMWTSFVGSTEGSESPHILIKYLRSMAIPERSSRPLTIPTGDAHSEEALTPAEELRSISGLSPALLGGLFGVSRTTFYNWMEGSVPRDARFQHLVDVLSHVKEAQRKLSPSLDVAAWLRTPISPGGRSPLDLLEQKRFSTFRGLLVRVRSAEMGLSTPLASIVSGGSVSREERRIARERVSRTPRLEEDEAGSVGGDDER